MEPSDQQGERESRESPESAESTESFGTRGGSRVGRLLPSTDLHTPVCILRVPGLDDSTETRQPVHPIAPIFMPPVYRPPIIKQNEKIKKSTSDGGGESIKGIPGGLLNDKLPLHVLKDDLKPNLYTHRLSYNTLADAYYENGNIGEEFIRNWKDGVFQSDNIKRKHEYDWNM